MMPNPKKPTGLKPLRVLIVDDSENDALLLVRELKRGGYESVYERVDTSEAMEKALANLEWDVIVSDYRMPRFGALDTLAMAQEASIEGPSFVGRLWKSVKGSPESCTTPSLRHSTV